MGPLAALVGVVMGSSVALFAGLFMTLLVLLLIPEFQSRLQGEFRPLLLAIGWSLGLVLVSALAFWGQVRNRPWRGYAQAALAVAVTLVGWYYWPR